MSQRIEVTQSGWGRDVGEFERIGQKFNMAASPLSAGAIISPASSSAGSFPLFSYCVSIDLLYLMLGYV